jgi:hypothetical protein
MVCECGYKPRTSTEILMLEQFSCAKTIKNTSGHSIRIECCKLLEGVYYAPGTEPERIEESPDALKEGIIRMDEAKALARKKALEEMRKTNKNV